MYERFTDRARKVMQLANRHAQRFNHEYIGTEHILLGLIEEGSGVAANVLRNLDVDLRKVRVEVEKVVQPGPDRVTMGKLPQTPHAKKVIEYSIEEARSLNHNYVGTEHLLLGLLRQHEGVGAQVLMHLGLQLADVREEVLNLLGHREMESVTATVGEPAPKKRSKTPLLSTYGLDQTEAVRQGQLAAVVGRQNEIARVIRVLCRRTHNNPLLIGEPGAGKTSIVRGVAERLVHGPMPPALPFQRLVVFDLSAVVGDRYEYAAFAKRMKELVHEVRRSPEVLLFLDDAHLLALTGVLCGPLTVALARGEIRAIAAATTAEYRQHIESESVLRRCFQTVPVPPASKELTLEILRRLRNNYEVHHQVEITDDALTAAVELADGCDFGRCRPGNAIDLLDEAAAYVRLRSVPPAPDLVEIEQQIALLIRQKEDAVSEQDFEKAANLRDAADQLRQRRDVLQREWQSQTFRVCGAVDAKSIAEVASGMRATGDPIDEIPF